MIIIKLSENNAYLRTQIIDQKLGLTENDKEKLFDKSQTLNARSTHNETLTRLELSIVKKYTEAMNGIVYCESEGDFIVTFKIGD